MEEGGTVLGARAPCVSLSTGWGLNPPFCFLQVLSPSFFIQLQWTEKANISPKYIANSRAGGFLSLHTLSSICSLRCFSSVQFSPQSCPTLGNPMNCSMPGLPVHHQLPEFTQTHVHRVGDAIQPSHPLSSPSPPAPNLSQHQSLFQWVNSSHEVAKVLEFQL